MAEYLLEENPTLMYRQAGEKFASDVAIIRDDVERLAKRIASLEKQTTDGVA
jgi:ubiquinone biosynthesis protein UbiJ